MTRSSSRPTRSRTTSRSSRPVSLAQDASRKPKQNRSRQEVTRSTNPRRSTTASSTRRSTQRSNQSRQPRPKPERPQGPQGSSLKEFAPLIIIVVLIIAFVVALKYMSKQNIAQETSAPAEDTTATQAVVSIPSHDRSKYNSVADQIIDLQDSIPASSKIEAFNDASLTEDDDAHLKEAIKEFSSRNYDVGFVLINLKNGKGISYNTDMMFYSASAIKAPYIASLLSQGNLKRDMKSNQRLEQDIENILIYSDNDAYYHLQSLYGTKAFQNWCVAAGVEHSLKNGESFTDITVADLAKMWLQMYADYDEGSISEEISGFATRPEESSIRHVLGLTDSTWSKAGWYPNQEKSAATNDAGIVETDKSVYVIAICSDAPEDFGLLDSMVEALADVEPHLR